MSKRKLYLLSISFLYGILFTIGNPTVPSYARTLSISNTFIGLYFASGGLGLLFFATIWGAVGDIKDRNRIIGLIFAGYGLGQLLFGLFRNEYMLLLSSLIGGVFYAGILVNLYSYINDSFTDEHDRNNMLSYTVSLYLLGSAIAYILGGLLTDILDPNFHYVFIIQAVLLFIVAAFIEFSKTTLIDTDHHLSRHHFFFNIKQAFKLPWLPIYTITLTFFVSFSHNNVKRWLDVYVIDSGYRATELGIIVFAAGIVGLIANVYIAPYFLRRFHNFRFLQVQFIIAPIMLYLAFSQKDLFFGLSIFYMIYTVILSVYEPTAISFMSDNKGVSQGILVGVRQSVVGLGTTVGFIVGGILYDIDGLYVFYLAIIFYIIVFVGFTILTIIMRKDIKSYRLHYKKERLR